MVVSVKGDFTVKPVSESFLTNVRIQHLKMLSFIVRYKQSRLPIIDSYTDVWMFAKAKTGRK